MIYLDNAATTYMFEDAVGVYQKYACQSFFNPSAGYQEAIKISKEIEEAKKQILAKLGNPKGDVIFTGGATESNNLAIMGSKRNGKWEYVFSVGEHPSVYNTAKELEMQGHKVHFVGLQPNGQVDYEALKTVLNEKTRLISVMHVSNETGAINDIAKILNIKKEFAPQALLHVDGVQAFCKIPVDLSRLPVDYYTVSAHKFHGPKGVECLYVKNISGLKNIVYGGGQEKGLRSGTENVPAIMAMAYVVGKIDVESNYQRVKEIKEVAEKIFSSAERVSVFESESPYILSVGFAGVNGETLMRALEQEGIIVGMGSACSARKAGNRILEGIGLSKDEVKTRIRISFNAYLDVEQVKIACEKIIEKYNEIWERVK